jgi:Ca2+-transporting ATPase
MVIESAKHFEDELLRLLAAAGVVSLCLGIITEGLRWGWLEGFSIFFAVALVVFVSSIDDYMHEQQFQMLKGESKLKMMRVYRAGKLYELEPSEVMVGDVIEIITNDRIFVDGVLLSGD